MGGPDAGRRDIGFRERTPVADARATLREAVSVLDAEAVPLEAADTRVLAAAVTADRNVPHYDRAAMDGYAVRATDTVGAADRSPALLALADEPGPGRAVRVHTGSAVPAGADAVVKIEDVERTGEEVAVTTPVPVGANVAPVGEDVTAGQSLFEPGHRLRPSDLGLCRSVGLESVSVTRQPVVSVRPTGEELVTADPAPGEIVETNGLTVARLVERWGGVVERRPIVGDDPVDLAAAIEADTETDIVVTTGGSSVGARDHLPEVVDELGAVLVHGVALKPGHPVCLGLVEDTPVCGLPGYPVACIVNAVQFLRPLLSWLQGTTPDPHPMVSARLSRKLPSEPGTRTFARVALRRVDDAWVAEPTRASGAGVLSSVALADGWVVIPEAREGIPEGEEVVVECWEATP